MLSPGNTLVQLSALSRLPRPNVTLFWHRRAYRRQTRRRDSPMSHLRRICTQPRLHHPQRPSPPSATLWQTDETPGYLPSSSCWTWPTLLGRGASFRQRASPLLRRTRAARPLPPLWPTSTSAPLPGRTSQTKRSQGTSSRESQATPVVTTPPALADTPSAATSSRLEACYALAAPIAPGLHIHFRLLH